MPEVAAAAKGGVSCKASKQSLTKVTKKPSKKWRKSLQAELFHLCIQSFAPGPPFHQDLLSKAMSEMDSFVVDIFGCIASEASHLIHYNNCHIISARKIQSAVRLMSLGELTKHAGSEGMKLVTNYTNSV